MVAGNNLPAVLLYKWCESAIEALLIEWLQLHLMFISIFSSTPYLHYQAVRCAVITRCRRTFFSSSHSNVNESTATIHIIYLHNAVFLHVHHTFNKNTEKITIWNGHFPHSLSCTTTLYWIRFLFLFLNACSYFTCQQPCLSTLIENKDILVEF